MPDLLSTALWHLRFAAFAVTGAFLGAIELLCVPMVEAIGAWRSEAVETFGYYRTEFREKWRVYRKGPRA